MKTTSRLIAILFMCTVYAQENNTLNNNLFDNWTLGIKGGGNLSRLLGDILEGDKAYVNYHFGAVVNKTLNDEWSIALEPHISVEGRNKEEGFERVTYLNIPVLAMYEFPNDFTIDGGFLIGIKLAELREIDDNGTRQRINRFKGLSPGLTLGTTYSLNRKWFTQFRFNYKISDVIRKDGSDTEGSSLLVFQISVGYNFGK